MRANLGDVQGYRMTYDSYTRKFYLIDPETEESIAWGVTQGELEEKAKKLKTAEFNLPIDVVVQEHRNLAIGKITSVNLEDMSFRCSHTDSRGNMERGRRSLRYGYVWEATQHNLIVAATIKEKGEKIKAIDAEIDDWITRLEKPIDPAYFGVGKA